MAQLCGFQRRHTTVPVRREGLAASQRQRPRRQTTTGQPAPLGTDSVPVALQRVEAGLRKHGWRKIAKPSAGSRFTWVRNVDTWVANGAAKTQNSSHQAKRGRMVQAQQAPCNRELLVALHSPM